MYKFPSCSITVLQENEIKRTYTDKKITKENDDESKTRNSMFWKSQQSTQIAIWRFKITSLEIECLTQNKAYSVCVSKNQERNMKKYKKGEKRFEKGECVEEIHSCLSVKS